MLLAVHDKMGLSPLSRFSLGLHMYPSVMHLAVTLVLSTYQIDDIIPGMSNCFLTSGRSIIVPHTCACVDFVFLHVRCSLELSVYCPLFGTMAGLKRPLAQVDHVNNFLSISIKENSFKAKFLLWACHIIF